jgi:two-component system, cell cycle sensor histidine kinase and response regulator CckA
MGKEIIADIKSTEHSVRESEQQRLLAESEARFRSAFDDSSFGRTMALPDGRLNRVNKALCQMLGYDAPTLAEKRIADITHPDDIAASQELVQSLLEGKAAARRMQKRYLHADGRTIWADVSVILIRDATRQPLHFLTEMVDINEQKQAEQKNLELERQLNQAQKMEAVGRLAGGVAHDFNNLLSIVLGYAETLLEELPDGDPRRDSLKEIFDAGSRAKQLTRQLLAFSRKQALELVHIDINTVVAGFEKLMRRVIGEDIELRLALAPEALLVKADVSQIEQVLMNLAVNARDAMPKGGRLTIETTMGRRDAYESSGNCSAPERYARISVSDTGTGMDRDTLQRLFEPFFTTKDKDHGTGLGLATSYGIVHQHGGTIEVFSESGHGTRFTIALPLVGEAPAQDRVASKSLERQPAAASILVVEDDPSVRKLAVNILRNKGYGVIESKNVHEAVELAAQQKEPVDLLLTDVVMPGMMGPEVFKKVAAHHPNIKVLYMSGYTYNILTQHGVPEGDRQLIQKPFSVKDLVNKVQGVLNSM